MLMSEPSPTQRLAQHFHHAIESADPCARYASFITVDGQGFPSARILTLQDVTPHRLVAFINKDSPKGQDLMRGSTWELAGFWPTLLIQYRVRGVAAVEQDETCRKHWLPKSRMSRVADHYHAHVRRQSSPVPSHATLVAEAAALDAKLPQHGLAIPDGVVSLLLDPFWIEIWVGSPVDRLHARTRYTRVDEKWSTEVLVP